MDFESRFELSTRDRQIFVHHRDLPRGPNLDIEFRWEIGKCSFLAKSSPTFLSSLTFSLVS